MSNVSGTSSMYYGTGPEDAYLAALPFAPSSASHPGLVSSHPQPRSPSRIPQHAPLMNEPYFVNGPPIGSSQAFVNQFLSQVSPLDHLEVPVPYYAVAQSPAPQMGTFADPMSGTPEFGAVYPQHSPVSVVKLPSAESEFVVPAVTRKKSSGIFKVLDDYSVPETRIDIPDLVKEVLANPLNMGSNMWSGLLTGTKFDKNYMSILLVMEKIHSAILEENLRKIKDQAQPLSVFLKRIWTPVLASAATDIEKFIIEYHKESCLGFYTDIQDEWDAEDEEREGRLDALDAELSELQAEIDQWEIIQKSVINSDSRMAEFLRSKSQFRKQLEAIESVAVDSKTQYLAAGAKPQLPAWEHPEIREKLKIQKLLQAEVDEAIAGFSNRFPNVDDASMGIPVGGFCFEPGVEMDSRWENWRPTGWEVDLSGQQDENDPMRPMATPGLVIEEPHKEASGNRRLSMDALRAFN